MGQNYFEFIESFKGKYLELTTTIATDIKKSTVNNSHNNKPDGNNATVTKSYSNEWNETDCKRHQEIEVIVSDWLDMLTVCNYI